MKKNEAGKRRETRREPSTEQSELDGPERFVSGLPELKASHPRVALMAAGRSLALGEGKTVALYDLEHGEDGTVSARQRWCCETEGELLSLVSAQSRVLCVIERQGEVHLEAVNGETRAAIATLPGRPSAVAVAGDILLAAIQGTGEATPRLVEIHLSSGARVAESPLASANVQISTSPSGRFVSVVNQTTRTMTLREDRGTPPCPPRPSGCDCPPAPGGHERPEPERPYNPTPCRPSDAAIPDDHGGAIVSDGGRVGRRPNDGHDSSSPLTDCWGRLFWIADGLKWAGAQHVLATKGNYVRRMAILAADNFRVLAEREFGNAGALVFSAPDSDAIVIYHPGSGRFEWTHAVDDRYVVDPLFRFPEVIVPAEEKTFVGQRVLSLLPDHIRTKGQVNVLVLPVIEPGQAYNEPNLDKLAAFQGTHFFGAADAYYRENSFGKSWLSFKMFGHHADAAPGGRPLPLPRGIGSYFFPPFFPGGIELTRGVPLSATALVFEGSETLTLRARSRPDAGSPVDFTLHFAAMLLRADHDAFPIKIQTTGAELVLMTVRERNGTSLTLTLAFPAKTIVIKKDDVDGGCAQLAAFLGGVIAIAEAAAGVSGGRLFAEPVVRRVTKDGLEFGELHVSLSFAARPAGAGRLQIDGIWPAAGLKDLGFDDIIRARFAIAADFPRFNDYLGRLVAQAQADKKLTFDTSVLGAASSRFDFSTSQITTQFLIANKQGGPGAFISLVTAVGLDQLIQVSKLLFGSESTEDNANAPKDMGGLINDAFSAAMARLRAAGDPSPLTKLAGFDLVVVGFVMSGAKVPAAERWNADDPKISASLREAQTPFTAEDAADKAKPQKDRKQLTSRWILARLDDEPAVSTLCHELGHAYGFDDTYQQMDFRDDLAYLQGLSLMDAEHALLPHHAAYHKWQAEWIPETDNPLENGRIVDAPKPARNAPTQTDALLVPVEYWDAGMEAAVRAAYPGVNAKVAQLIRIDLGGDMGMFDIVEARQRRATGFSTNLPDPPFLLVTNAIVPWDRTRYAVEGKYRRELHRLSSPPDLNADEEEYDLARAPELPAKGVKVKILDIRTVPRPDGNVRVFHTRVTREEAEYIDVAFTIGDPYYRSPDLWLDWPVVEGQPPFIYPEGSPTDQGKPVKVPQNAVKEKHAVVARVRNYGNVPAVDVRVEFYVNRPPGGGDKGAYQRFAETKLDEVQPGKAAIAVGIWDVDQTEHGHTCLRAVIADSNVPEDVTTGIKLGSADVFATNNHCEKNVDVFVPRSGSPYEPVEFEYSVNNSGLRPEVAFLQPEGLSEGMMLTISPPRRSIAPGETVIFHCRLELDHEVIDVGCQSDRDFTLTTWRETPETAVNWGGCRYKVLPRKKTAASIKGSWFANEVVLDGRIDPDPSGGEIRLRINFDNQKARFQKVNLGPGGTWKLHLVTPIGAKFLETEAFYEGSRLFAPARSPLIGVAPYVVR